MIEDIYYLKYLKYKSKYLNLRTKKVSSSNFKMLGGGKGKIEIYLFKADWCPHCRGFKPIWDKLASELKSKYEFITVDADKDKDIIEKWKIQGFPTIIKKEGDKATEYIGPRDEMSVKEFINSN